VDQRDLPPPKHFDEAGYAPRIGGPSQMEDFRLKTSTLKLLGEPAAAPSRSDRTDLMATRSELFGEVQNHLLGSAWTVGVDQ
jgi:hypothetical protein